MESTKKRIPALIVSAMLGKPKGKPEPDGDEPKSEDGGDIDPGLESAAEDLLAAVQAKDVRAVAEALKNAFDCCGEGPTMHAEDES